ncbi:MAG: DUF1360 domain-containing protein, partial [Chloroflexota bacterium]
LMTIFLFTFAGFIALLWRHTAGFTTFQLNWLDLVLLAFSTLRLGHLVAYDRVTEPLRRPFARTVADGTGAGESVEPIGLGVRNALGQAISCPICAGTWIAAGLTYALVAFPGPARVFLTMTAAIGAASLLNAACEALSWNGQLARTRTGEIIKAQKRAIGARPLQADCDPDEEDTPRPTPAALPKRTKTPLR